MGSMQSQAQYVLRTVEERGVRFVQLWFTDVLGRHKAFHVTPAELEDALDRGNDLRRQRHRRLLAHDRGRPLGPARPHHLPAPALVRKGEGDRAGVLRHRQHRRHAV